jgi:diguanylate cyclase (GGDEF)-like protein
MLVCATTPALPRRRDRQATIGRVRMVTEAEWDEAQASVGRLRALTGIFGCFGGMVLVIPAMALGNTLGTGLTRYLLAGGFMGLILAPLVVAMVVANDRRQQQADGKVRELTHQLSEAALLADREAAERGAQVRSQKFESRLANALDMAEGEPEVIEVIERSFASMLPESPVELLLADNSHAHLLRMATASPTGAAPGCCVDSPDHCPAARRAQVQRFEDSDDLDACPKLRNRPEGRLSALCVPVSIMGRTVGVIHATAPPKTPVDHDAIQDLGTLAKLAGARIGLLRVMSETQLQASTDSLTGLLNRRSFEERLATLRRSEAVVAVAMADLDQFKALNDIYGHDTGDRALRLFAQVLRESVRAQDLTCRYGGEEFIVALPACTADTARHALDAARARLDAAATAAGLPNFTVSFGVIDASTAEGLPELASRADAALFEAKHEGRDRVVVHDAAGKAVARVDNLSESSPFESTTDGGTRDGRPAPDAETRFGLKSVAAR